MTQLAKAISTQANTVSEVDNLPLGEEEQENHENLTQ